MELLGSLGTMLLPLHTTAKLSHLPSTGLSHPCFAEDCDGLSSCRESLGGTVGVCLPKKEKQGGLLQGNNWWLLLEAFSACPGLGYDLFTGDLFQTSFPNFLSMAA